MIPHCSIPSETSSTCKCGATGCPTVCEIYSCKPTALRLSIKDFISDLSPIPFIKDYGWYRRFERQKHKSGGRR